MSRRFCLLISFAVASMAPSCKSSTAPGTPDVCSGYGDWQTSPYVLPYAEGQSFKVIQGNCAAAGNGHTGVNKYSYDFDMPIGTPFTAARSGTVVAVDESHLDGQVAATGFDNYIVIAHADGTAALYGHLTHDGAKVSVGEVVGQGDVIGSSGNTGNTSNIPHLHFSVQTCDPVKGGSTACPTVPSNFKNTDANPTGLVVGRSYLAKPYSRNSF